MREVTPTTRSQQRMAQGRSSTARATTRSPAARDRPRPPRPRSPGAFWQARSELLPWTRWCTSATGERHVEDGEFSAGLTSWDQAPAPAQVGKRLVEGLFSVELPAKSVPVLNNVTQCA